MKKKILLSLSASLFMLLLGSIPALAQTGSLAGTVTDSETGETVPGANVMVTELERGAATDLEGYYQVDNIPAGTYSVSVTFIGYATYSETVQILADEETILNIQLESGAIGLDEVIVSGYAVTNKRELTGSISSVRSSEIENVTLQSAESLLQGRAAGVNIITTSGNPGGAFRVAIRGNGSINAATEPLYIVDGVQLSFSQQADDVSTSPLNAINPSEIESIEVLKDASAAAIYGSQAAAGVVIITTKSGRKGDTQVTARAETGIRSLARNVDYLSTAQHVDFFTEAVMLDDGIPLQGNDDVFTDVRDNTVIPFYLNTFGEDPSNPGHLANYNWQDYVYEEGVTQKYSASVSGGDDKTTFYLAGGFEDTDGTAYKSNFTRLNLRTNIDHQINDKFRASLKSNIARSTQAGVCQDGNYVNCPTAQVMFFGTMMFPYLADGSYNSKFNVGGRDINPAVVKNEVDRDAYITHIISNLNLTYNVQDWLSLKGSVNVDFRNTEEEQFRSPIAATSQGGFVSFRNKTANNFSTNLVANFNKTLDSVHRISGLVGTEYRRDYAETQYVRGEGLPGSFFRVLNATSSPAAASGSSTEWRIGSYFSNVKYNYDEKYYLSVTGRYDGHSRFGNDTRWAFFPSASVAWRVTQEDFFDIEPIDELKFRLSYGRTGNSAIGNFASRGLYSAAGSYNEITALVPDQLANVNLSWEEAQEINLGLDYELLDGRIYGAIDVYQKDNKNLLFDRPLPTDAGFSSITENIGTVRNKGFEFEINTVNVNTENFVWSTRFNISLLDNEILDLPDGQDVRPDDAFESLKEGRIIGLIQVPKWAGVNPADGRPMWYDIDGNITYNPVQAEDAIEYKDGFADTIGGFGNTISYKGFTLDAFFQFSFGQWALPGTDYYFTRTADYHGSISSEVLDRWRNPGDLTYYPRATQAGGNYVETEDYRSQLGTHSIYNASYIRLKNVSLSYNLPVNVVGQLGLNNIRIYASATNLLTWTAWPWYDPEVAFDTRDIYTNFTQASYPTERQGNIGIEIQF